MQCTFVACVRGQRFCLRHPRFASFRFSSVSSIHPLRSTIMHASTLVSRSAAALVNDAGFSFAPKRWPLNLEQMRCLFEKLAEDNGYRTLFMTDLGAAFAQLPGAPAVPA